jgi:putative ABC transport system ATP-binding protein
MTQALLLETHNLCKSFRAGTKGSVCALDSITLTIPQGSFTMLRGPSGSGKTTLLSLLGALDRPTSGSVLFQGRNFAECSDVELARLRRRMGFVFQDFSLIPRLSVWENITYPLIPRGVSKRDRWKIAQRLLVRLRIAEKHSMFPHELSGGEQQRVALARALAGEPKLVLSDEPTSNLDPENGRAVLDLMQEVHAGGTTVIISTHDPELLPRATNVFELLAGQLKTEKRGS